MNATIDVNAGGSLIVTTTGEDAMAAQALLSRIEKTAKTVRDLTRLTELAAQRYLTSLRDGEMPFSGMPAELSVEVATLIAYNDAAELVGLGKVAKMIVAAVTVGNLVHVQPQVHPLDQANLAAPGAPFTEPDRDRISQADQLGEG